MNLCKYRHIFGIEGRGIHSYRFMNIAIVDFIFTIIGAYIFFLLFQYWKIKISFFSCLISLFILGIVLHRLFCVRTTIDKMLFSKKVE